MSVKSKLRATAMAVLLATAGLSAHADLARVGPSNVPSPAGHGFPFWYQDLNGMVLDFCLPNASDPGALQQTACLLTGLPQNPPYVFPTNFPDEVFYHRAVSDPLPIPGGKRAIVVLALEGAFASGGAQAGQQIVFTRIRVTAGVPEAGSYTVTHPYGVETFPDVASGVGNRDIVFSEDVGIGAPGVFTGALTSRVGPFLSAATVDPVTGARTVKPPVTLNGAQFLSDGVGLEAVIGSPFGTNYFEICGVRADGTPINLGGPLPGLCARTELFSLTGKLHDLVASPIGSPLTVDRATYSRDSTGSHVDVTASVLRGIGQAAPKLTAGGFDVPPVLMSGPTVLGEFYAQGIPLPPGAIPSTLTVTNSGDVPPTSAITTITDALSISQANYDPFLQTLTVVATSSDKGNASAVPAVAPPALALDGFPLAVKTLGAIPGDPASVQFVASPVAIPPTFIGVTSAAGGQTKADVAMGPGPTFPAGVPFAQNDFATAIQGGPAVIIPVRANDTSNPAAPANPGAVTILAPGATSGTAVANADGTVTYTPGLAIGTATFRYTLSNAVGTSNVGTVSVDVTPNAAGPIPTANADTAQLSAATSVVMNVLANDTANGGTLNPASVTIVPGSLTGGTATVDPATGAVTFTAGTVAGTFGFDYTVANTNGQVSPAVHDTVTVVNPEALVATKVLCKRAGTAGEWTVQGTSTVSVNNTVTAYVTGLVPASPTAAQTIGSGIVGGGTWRISSKSGPACVSPVSIQSTLGTKQQNLLVTIQ